MKTAVLRYCRNDARHVVWFFAFIIFSVLGLLPALGHAQHRQGPQSDTLSARESAAQVLFNQARAAERKHPDRALATYEQIAQKYGKNDTPFLRLLAVKAMFRKAEMLLGKDNNTRDAILTFERIENRFGQDKELPVRELLASALVSKAETLYKQGNAEKALAAYVQFDRKFDRNESDFIRQLVDITKWRSAEIRTGGNMLSSSQ
jgi:tetratricopeptide (TPR) repeat protein